MQPDQPAPQDPNPIPPAPPSGAGDPPPMPEAQPQPVGGTPKYNFGTVPSPQFSTTLTKDEKMWGMLLHLGGALGGLTASFGVPGGNFIIPLIIWLVKKDESPFIHDQGKEAINFQLCILILSILCICTCIGAILVIPIALFALIIGIIGAIKASEGVAYRYPVNFRMI